MDEWRATGQRHRAAVLAHINMARGSARHTSRVIQLGGTQKAHLRAIGHGGSWT